MRIKKIKILICFFWLVGCSILQGKEKSIFVYSEFPKKFDVPVVLSGKVIIPKTMVRKAMLIKGVQRKLTPELFAVKCQGFEKKINPDGSFQITVEFSPQTVVEVGFPGQNQNFFRSYVSENNPSGILIGTQSTSHSLIFDEILKTGGFEKISFEEFSKFYPPSSPKVTLLSQKIEATTRSNFSIVTGGLDLTGILELKQLQKEGMVEALQFFPDEWVTICHIPPRNPKLRKTLTVSRAALEDHLSHGDPQNAFPNVILRSNSTPQTSFAGSKWTLLNPNAPFSPRFGIPSVVFDKKIWVIGGRNVSSPHLNDVWSSPDGINWTEATSSASFSPRSFHEALSFQNQLWVLGGQISGDSSNEIWKSSDGSHWTLATDAPSWSPRSNSKITFFKNEFFLIGGVDSTGARLTDVHKSADLLHWSEVTSNGGFGTRESAGCVVFNDGRGDRLWIIGGYGSGTGSGGYHDVYSSPDGAHWTLEITNARFGRSWGHNILNHAGKLWFPTHYNGSYVGKTYTSQDGKNWVLFMDPSPWGAGVQYSAVVFKNKMFILGGDYGHGIHSNRVYSSP